MFRKAILAAAMVAALACSNSDKGGGAAAGGGKVEGLAKTATTVLPEDTGLVFGLSWKQFAGTRLFEKLGPKLLQQEDVRDALELVKTTCGIDLVKDVDSVLVALPDTLDEDKTMILVKGAWTEDKINGCVGKIFGQLSGGEAKVEATKQGKLTVFDAMGVKFYVAWVDKDTVLMTASGFEGDASYLEKIVSGATSLKSNKKMMTLLGRTETSQTIWLAMNKPTGGEAAQALGDAEGFDGFWVSLKIDKKLGGMLGVRFEDEKSAKKAEKEAQDGLTEAKKKPMVKKYLGSAKIKRNGNDVVFTADLSEKHVNEMTDAVANMSEEDLGMALLGLSLALGGGL